MINLILSVIAFRDRQCTHIAEQYYSKANYNREYNTLHINAGRRTGKTHAMCTLARKGDIIIVHNEQTKRHLKHAYPNCLASIHSAAEFNECRNRCACPRIVADRVWIDEVDLCENQLDTNALYDIIDAKLFIKLGE